MSIQHKNGWDAWNVQVYTNIQFDVSFYQLLGQYSNAMKAMKLFDYSQNGYIQKHELRKVLENFCFKMTDSQFER